MKAVLDCHGEEGDELMTSAVQTLTYGDDLWVITKLSK